MRKTQKLILVYLGKDLKTTSTAKNCAPRLKATAPRKTVTTAKTIASAAKEGKKYYYIILAHPRYKTLPLTLAFLTPIYRLQQNRKSAKKCRLKKKEEFHSMKSDVMALQDENKTLKDKVRASPTFSPRFRAIIIPSIYLVALTLFKFR